MQKILFISSDKKIPVLLKDLFNSQPIEFSLFSKEEEFVYSDFAALVIVEPYVLKNEYLSIFSIWKLFLAKKAQETKLLVAGFASIAHSNYVNLLNISGDFDWEKKIDQALLPIQKWKEQAVLTAAPDIKNKLSLFFTGHNYESLIDCIIHVRATLDNAKNTLYGNRTLHIEKGDKDVFQTIWKEILIPGRSKFREFFNRWRNYAGYFDIMPFNDELEKHQANAFVQQLNTLFSGVENIEPSELSEKEALFRSLNAFGRIGALTQTLTKINKTYINPEPIADLLLIDDDEDFYRLMVKNFAGFHFHHVSTSRAAVNILGITNFDVILLDLQLSGAAGNVYEGVDLIPVLRRIAPQTPLAVVSTHSKSKIIERTLKNGADFYLTKTSSDVEKWSRLFIKLAGRQSFSLEEILAFNDISEQKKKANILVIEDEEKWFDQLKALSNAYHYKWARTIRQAMDIIEEKPSKFDLILLDLYFMEEGKQENSGLKLLHYSKSSFPHLPVIVMTRSTKDKDQFNALDKEADFYLMKPQFNGPTWTRIMDLLIQLKQLKEQLKS